MSGALLLAGLLAIPASGLALAAPQPQEPPPQGDLILVNRDRPFVDRWKNGFVNAHPVFNRQVDVLYYALRHPDDGEWLTPMIRVVGQEGDRQGDGWKYSFLYPPFGDDTLPDDIYRPDRESTYLLVLLAGNEAEGDLTTFHAVVPVYQPNGLWDRVLRAFSPSRWARAIAGWFIEGAHGTLCGVVEKVTGDDIANCRVGS